MGLFDGLIASLPDAKGSTPSAKSSSTGGGEIESLLRNKAVEYDIDPDLFVSLAKRESGLRPDAKNPNPGSTAGGLFQFIDGTWNRYGNKKDKFDPEANADAAARMLRDHLGMFEGDYSKALAAHHVGAEKAATALKNRRVGDKDVSTQQWLSDIFTGAGRDNPMAKPRGAFSDAEAGVGGYDQIRRGQIAQAASDESPVSTSLKRGMKGLTHSAGLAIDNMLGDSESAAQRIIDKQAFDQATPAPSSVQKFGRDWDELAEDDYSGMFGTVLKNPAGSFNMMLEQTPNSLPGMTFQTIAGVAGRGLMAFGPVGAAAGLALQSAAALAGNFLPEGGAFLEDELHKSGVDTNDVRAMAKWIEEHRGENFKGGATKAGVISAVDGVTGWMGMKMLAGPSVRFAKAEKDFFTKNGVNVADSAALQAARASDAYKTALQPFAADLVKATEGFGMLKRGVGATALDAMGEGVGEYAGSYAATGDASIKDAVLEGVMGVGQGAAMAGAQYGIGKMSGPDLVMEELRKLATANIAPAEAKPNSPLSNAAQAAQAADPITEALKPISERFADRALYEQIRNHPNLGPDAMTQILSAYRVATNSNMDPMARQAAVDRLGEFFRLFDNQPNFTAGRADATGVPDVVGNKPSAVGPVDPRVGAIDGEASRVAPNQQQGVVTQSAPALATDERARKAAAAEYEAAYQDLVKAEQLGVSDQELMQRQIAMRNAENRLQEINEAIEANRAKETAEKRGALLDRVLASNPGNPNRAFDRALRLEGFRDATFTKEEKEKIARFNELRSIQEDGVFSAPNEAGAFGIREKRPSAVAGRYQHIADMLSSGWQLVNKHQLTGPNGEVYNLKGAGEAQFVRNKLNQKAGNGNQSPRDGSQGGTDQGDNGVGSAGANGPVPQGGGNGSGQANAIPDTDAPAGAVSEAEATGAGNQPNNSLARSRLTALEDQRIAKYADELRSMAPDSGWAEEGGRLLIAPDGTKSRAKWIPRAEWFIAGMLNSPQESVAAVEKAISGQPMRKAEKLHVQGMMDFLDMQYGIDGESHTEQLATLSDIAYEGESADAQNIIDTLGDVDLESIGAWNDEVESMRALGLTEEEINEITRRKQGAFGAIGEEAAGVPAGEAQTAIPEGDGNGNGQAEGQEGFSLNQQTNTEAAAQFAQQQAGESTEITKEQADKERDAVPFSMQMQSQPKPQGMQVGLFTADGRPTVAAKQEEPKKQEQGDLIGASKRDLDSVAATIEEKRRQLVALEDKMVGLAGLGNGFVEDALRSRKVPGALKDQRHALKAELADLRKQHARLSIPADKRTAVEEKTNQWASRANPWFTVVTDGPEMQALAKDGAVAFDGYRFTLEKELFADKTHGSHAWRWSWEKDGRREQRYGRTDGTAREAVRNAFSSAQSDAREQFFGMDSQEIDRLQRPEENADHADKPSKVNNEPKPAAFDEEARAAERQALYDKIREEARANPRRTEELSKVMPAFDAETERMRKAAKDGAKPAEAQDDNSPERLVERAEAVAKKYDDAGYPDHGKIIRASLKNRQPTRDNVEFWESSFDRNLAQWKTIEKANGEGNAPVEPKLRTRADLIETKNEDRAYDVVPDAVTNAVLDKLNGYIKQLAEKGLHLDEIDTRFPNDVQVIKRNESGLRGLFNRYAKQLNAIARGYKRANEDGFAETEADLADWLGVDVKNLREQADVTPANEGDIKQGTENKGPEVNTLMTDGTFKQWQRAVQSLGKVNGWTLFRDDLDGERYVLMTSYNSVGFDTEQEARDWAKDNKAVKGDFNKRDEVAIRERLEEMSADDVVALAKAMGVTGQHYGTQSIGLAIIDQKSPQEIAAAMDAMAASEPNLAAAKALIQEAKDTHGDKRKEAIVRKKARELAQKTPLSDEKTVLALDMVSTRLGMGDGGTKALEFLPSVDGEQNKPASISGKAGIDSWRSEFESAKKDGDKAKIQALYDKVRIVLNGIAQSHGDKAVSDFNALKKEIEQYAKNQQESAADEQEAGGDAEKLGDLIDYERFVLISADDISKLRKIDVDRVLEQGAVKEFRQEFADWIKAKRPDLAAEVNDVMAELAPKYKETISVPDLIGESTPAGKNDAGELLFDNKRGRFRVRHDSPVKYGSDGYADFGGDLAPIEKSGLDKAADAIDAKIDDVAARLAAKLKASRGTLNSGVDPELLMLGAELGSLYIAKGFVKFAQYSRAILDKLKSLGIDPGEVKPMLKEFYLASQAKVDDATFDQMDDPRAVRKFDLDSLDSEQNDGLRDRIDAAEQATNHDATPAQKEAGNYAKGKFPWNGLTISVETAKGEDRTDKETGGDKWRVTMPATYGYILGTVGADKDHVDVFMGDKPESQRVYVVNQTKPGSTEFDEHKIMLGYESEGAAIGDYLLSFSDTFGASVLGSVSGPYAIDDFKHMLESNRFGQAKPISDRLAYVNPRVEEKTVEPQPPGVRANGDKEKAAAERLAKLLDKMDQVRIDRNTPEGSAKGIVRSVIEELRKERTAVSVVELLETASQRLLRQHAPFSEVIDQVVESLRSDASPIDQGDIKQAPVSLDKFGLTVRRSQTKNGTPTWEVSGNTRDHVATLRNAGGKWYGPKKVWSFYSEESPESKILAALGAMPRLAEVSLSEIEVERKSEGTGRIKTYKQRADEALSEIDERMGLGKQLLECLNS